MSYPNGFSKLGFFLAGLGVGAGVAVLFAPKSGKETRRFIAEKAGEGRDLVTAKGRALRRQSEELVAKAKDLVAEQKVRLAGAVEAGRRAAFWR